MKRCIAITLAAIALSFGACGGGGDSTASTPTPSGARPGFIQPADKARNTVDRLNQQQNQQEQQTGNGSGY